MKLHEMVNRTYERIKKLIGIQVLSNNGTWEDISHVSTTPEQDVYEIRTASYRLKCSEDHILMDCSGNEVFAKDCLGKIIETDSGPEKIISVIKTKYKEKLYDISLSGDKHTYFTNGILSHNCLILDEFAFVPNNITDALFTAVYPVVSSSKNGKVIIVSTPNGKHNLYYELWRKANNKDDPDNADGWRPFRMDWWQVPGRDEKWKASQIAAIGKTRFAQEFNNEFLDDVTTVRLISDEVADRYRIQLTEFKQKRINQGKVLLVTSKDGKKSYPFTMYHDFDPTRTYLASGDVAEGVKKDSSVLYVWDVTDTSNIRMCCKFSENDVSILEFAYIAKEILALYADPFLACESNGISLGFIEQLRVTYGYENFVMMNKGGCGIDSHFVVKTRACLWLRDMMTTVGFGFELYDPDLVDEFPTFIKKDLKVHTVYTALKGTHDDHIMSLVWACWILHPDNIQRYFDVVATFRSSTGTVYPKRLRQVYDYLPSDVERIMGSAAVREFQIYKQRNNNEFLQEHERKVDDQRRGVAEYVEPVDADGDAAELMEKNVLSEDEVVRMMRMHTGRDAPDAGGRTMGRASTGRVFSIGDVQCHHERNPNVVWTTAADTAGGIDSLFGFDDWDEGRSW